jgi:hypothetical protein
MESNHSSTEQDQVFGHDPSTTQGGAGRNIGCVDQSGKDMMTWAILELAVLAWKRSRAESMHWLSHVKTETC